MAEKLGEAYVEIGAKTANSIDQTLKGVKGKIDGLSKMVGLGAATALAWKAAKEVFQIVGESIERIAKKDIGFGDQLKETKSSLENAVDSIVVKFAPAIKVAAEFVEGLAITIANWIEKTIDAGDITSAFTAILEGTVQVFVKVGDAVMYVVNWLKFLWNVAKDAGAMLVKIGSAIKDFIQPALDAIGDAFNWVAEKVAYLIDKMKLLIPAMVSIGLLGAEALESLAEKVDSIGIVSDETKKAFSEFGDSARTLFTDSGSDRAKAFVGDMRALAKSTKSATDQTKELKKELAFMGVDEVFKKAVLGSMGADGAKGVDFGKAFAANGGNGENAAFAQLEADRKAGEAAAGAAVEAAMKFAGIAPGADTLTDDAIYDTATNTEKAADEQAKAVKILSEINRNIRGFGPGF